MRQLAFEITGMTCGGCINALRNALTRAGLEVADVSVGTAKVAAGDDAGADATLEARARAAIEGAGFSVVAARPATPA